MRVGETEAKFHHLFYHIFLLLVILPNVAYVSAIILKYACSCIIGYHLGCTNT